MALDKVVDSAKLEAGLKQICDAVREKGGTSAQLAFPDAIAQAVGAIETALPTQEKTVSITENGDTTITPDVGKLLSKVIAQVNVAGGGGAKVKTGIYIPASDIDIKKNPLTIEHNLGEVPDFVTLMLYTSTALYSKALVEITGYSPDSSHSTTAEVFNTGNYYNAQVRRNTSALGLLEPGGCIFNVTSSMISFSEPLGQGAIMRSGEAYFWMVAKL